MTRRTSLKPQVDDPVRKAFIIALAMCFFQVVCFGLGYVAAALCGAAC